MKWVSLQRLSYALSKIEARYSLRSHSHTPASIGAASVKHNHSTLNIVRSPSDNWSGGIAAVDRSQINTARSPKSAFLPANCITVEYSSDAGKTWEDYGMSEAQKRDLFALAPNNGVKLSKSSPVSTNDCVRITIEPLDRYVSFDQLYIWFSIGSHTCTLDLERSTIGAKDTFSFIRKDVPLDGWSGPNVINFPYGTFGGGVSQNGNNYKYRMTFRTTKLGNSTTTSPTISDIRFYGDNAWSAPNDMVRGDYLFSWDRDMNVNFSKQLKEQGKRVYSDNNKPTPASIGALGKTEKAADSSKLAGLTPVVDNPGPSKRNTWYFPFTGTNSKDGTRKYYAALYADHATTSDRARNLSMGLNGSDLWVYYS